MIISYSKHGKSGTSNYPFKNATAKILEGDRELTQQLIENSNHKLKYRSGIISFEEKNPSREIVQDVIEHFKKSTFAGLDQEQYNLLMVEHTDTDNYHIHFYIPRVELTSGKALNPHWHQQDQARLLKLQDYLNAKHGLSNPYEADKRRTLKNININALNRNEIKEQINNHIEELVIAQKLQNRDEVVNYFTESGIDVKRATKSSITIQHKNEKIRLEGIYYAKAFTNISAITEELTRAEREHIPATQRELRELKQELDKLIQHKAETNRARYPKVEQNYDREFGLRARIIEKEQVVHVHSDSNDKPIFKLDSDMVLDERMANSTRIEIREQLETKIHRDIRESINQEQPRECKIIENKRVEHDSIRANVTRRTSERERAEQFSLKSTKAEPNGIYSGIAKNFSSIRERSKEDYTQLRADTQRGTSEEQSIVREVFTERSGGISSIKKRFIEVIEHAKEFVNKVENEIRRLLKEPMQEQYISRGRSFNR